MILEALGRFHAKSTTGTPAQPTNTTDQDPPASIMDLSAPVQSDDPEAPPSSTPASPSYTGRQSVRSATSVGRASSAVSITSSSSSAPFSSTKGSQASRRMSNNLFGSGKFRDYSYIRTVNHQRRTDSTRSDTPTHSDATTTGMDTITINKSEQSASIYSDAHSPRPVTPEGSGHSTSISSSPSRDKAADSASETSDTTTFSSRLTKALSPDHLRRASRALDEVIRELEEEGDDEIVMERFPITRVLSTKPIVRYPEPSLVFHLPPSLIVNTTPHQLQPEPERTMSPLPPTAPASASTAEFEAGQAFSSDEPVVVDETHPESPSGSRPHSRQASPVPRLPGYIPGMPRPMTPHDSTSSQSTVDTDDQTPSATPRATSPRLPSITSQSPMFSQSLVSSLLRSNSSASTTNRNGQRSRSPASASGTSSPLFFHRSTNGRFTPDERTRNTSGTPDSDPESPTLNRRRPTSPLSGQAYQPLNSSTSTSHPNISRPSTPSNIVWNPPSSTRTGRSGSFTGYFSNSGHSRNNSSTSIGVTSTEALAGHAESFLDRSKSLTRSLRSPALPDSPFVDNGHTGAGISSMMGQGYGRPPSAMSGIDLGSPVGNPSRPLRSPTPTHAHNGSASPIGQMFPSFMNGSSNGLFNHNNHTSSSSPSPPSPRASSRQNQHGSFSLSPAHALLLQPLANSSRSSLESAGSSYHSWDEENKNDRLFGFFGKLDPQQPEWHDITISVHDKSGSTTSTTATTTTTSGTTESSPSIGGSGGSTVESEEVVRRVIGLTKNDFVSIQDKLVAAALTKAATPEGRNRAASLRRRRPSTSQSNYSTGGGDNRVWTFSYHNIFRNYHTDFFLPSFPFSYGGSS